MKKKMLFLILLGGTIVTSFTCRFGNTLKTQPSVTNLAPIVPGTLTSTRISPSDTSAPARQTPTSTSTAVPPTQASVSEKTIHFDQGPEPLDFTGEEFTSCIGSEELRGLDIRSGQGLATYNRTDKTLQIWGEGGFRQPFYSVSKTASSIFFMSIDLTVSSNHEWLYYWRRLSLDSFDVWVVNPRTGEQTQKHFEDVTLAGYPWEYWAGPSHLVFPLQFEEDVYNWMVWDPFTDEVEFISARLPGVGKSYERTHIAPVYDPRSEQVVYPCVACGDEDFRAYHVPSQRVVWAVEFGDDPFDEPERQPVWSEDGERMAFYFGLNKLWVVSRDGRTILKAILPYGDAEVWTASLLSWSPDGKRLAIIRDSKNPTTPIISILFIEEGTLVNLCAKIDYGSLGWSYDNRHIFYISHRSADYTESVIAILDTTTGEGWQDVIPEDLVFTGWLKP